VGMPSSKSICQEGGGSGGMGDKPKPSEEALAFWDRWEKLPFAKQMALKKMLGRKAAEGKAKADWDKMNAMLAWAEKTDLTEMKRLATEAKKGNSSMIPGPVAQVQQAVESSKAGAEKKTGNAADKGAPTTSPGGSEAPLSGSGDKGDAGGITATRSNVAPKSAGSAKGLRPYLFIPNDYHAPVKDEKLSGLVMIAWTKKPGEDPVAVTLPGTLTMIYRGPLKGKEVDGKVFERWILSPLKSETYEIPGREGSFFMDKNKSFAFYIPKSIIESVRKK